MAIKIRNLTPNGRISKRGVDSRDSAPIDNINYDPSILKTKPEPQTIKPGGPVGGVAPSSNPEVSQEQFSNPIFSYLDKNKERDLGSNGFNRMDGNFTDGMRASRRTMTPTLEQTTNLDAKMGTSSTPNKEEM